MYLVPIHEMYYLTRNLRLFRLTLLLWAGIMLDVFLHRGARGLIILAPNVTEAAVRSQLILRCQTNIKDHNDPIEWHFQSHGDAPFSTLYKFGKIFGHEGEIMVSCNISSGLSELVIPSVSLNHSGTYLCLDDDSQAKAEIGVFERFPSEQHCSLMKPSNCVVGINRCSIEPDQIQLSCQLRYKGNLKPYLEWFVNGERKISSINSTSNGTLTSTVVWKAYELQSPTFSCRLKYEDNKITSHFVWNQSVPVITMLDSSTIVEVECETSQRNCTVEKNFGCECNWIDESDKPVANGSILIFSDLPDGHYRAITTCFTREKHCSFVTEIISYNCGKVKSDSSSFSIVLIIVINIVVVTALAVVCLMILVRLRKSIIRCISEHGEKPKFRQGSFNEKENWLNHPFTGDRKIDRTVSVPCFSPIQAST